MGSTSIEWTSGPVGEEGYTFNGWLGCAKAHAGCTHCYAEVAPATALRKGGRVHWGEVWQGGQRVVVSDATWRKPLTWAREAARAGQRRKVFCSSLADVLEVPREPEAWPRGWSETRIREASNAVITTGNALADARARLWPIIEEAAAVCGGCLRPCATAYDTAHRTARLAELASAGAACEGTRGGCTSTGLGGLDFLLLTKRPENADLVPPHIRALTWLGTSISDQKTADEWVPRLLASQGFRLRFLSVEPLVGPVDLSRWLPGKSWYMARCRGCGYTASSATFREVRYDGDADVECPKCFSLKNDDATGIGWVIVGGESGPRARPCNVEWVRDIVRQCREAGVPCFVKQLGAVPATSITPTGNFRTNPETQRRQVEMAVTTLGLVDKKGGDMAEWPEDLRVQQFPEVAHAR